MMGLLCHDLGTLLTITRNRNLLETQLCQGITQQKPAGHLIIDDEDLNFFS
jgi:hypothetical protein